jgi:hypothetical protein
MAINFDQIMSYMTRVGTQVGVQPMEDKGSNVKGNDTFTTLSQDKNLFTKESHTQMHKSTHTPNDATLAHKQIYQPPLVSNGYYYYLEETDWMHRKTPTRNPNQQNKGATKGQHYQDVEYPWNDCTWTHQEVEAFNPFATHPPKPTIQPFNSIPNNPFHPKQQPPFTHCHIYKPLARQPTPNTFHQPNNFNGQLRFQHKSYSQRTKIVLS